VAATCAVGLVILFGFCSLAAVDVVLLSDGKSAEPGSFVTHIFSVANPDPAETAFTLEFSVPAGWEILGAPDAITLNPNQQETLFVTVTIPAEAQQGNYGLDVTATAQGDSTNQDTERAWTRIEPMNEVSLSTPQAASVTPGGAIEYVFWITNRGNVQDSYGMVAHSSRGFLPAVSASRVHLAPQESGSVTVRIDVPATADAGRDVLTVQVASMLYEGVAAEVSVATTVLPPGPNAVDTVLMEILPARIRLSMDKDVISGGFDSRLTFSVSGAVLDGYFSLFLNVNDPFGPDPVELSSYSLLYRREPAVYTLGTVSKRLTDLVSLSCQGGSVEIDLQYLDISFIGGGLDSETRAAGSITLGPETANFGLVYSDVRDETRRAAILGATAEAQPLDDWWLRGEAALGTDAGLTSSAIFLHTELDKAGYFLSGDVFSVGTYFPGSRPDSAGIRLSQRLRLTDLSLSLSLSHDWNNVIADPLASTQVSDALGFNLSADPLADGPTLSTTVEFSWDRSSDIVTQDDVNLLLSIGLAETQGVFPYDFTAKTVDRIDRIHDTHLRTMTFSEGAGLSVDSFYLFLELTHEKQIDVASDLLLSGGTDLSVVFRPRGALHEASITLRNTDDDFDLSASLFVRLLDSLDVTFDGSIVWDRADLAPPAFGWGITWNATLDIPLPFLVTKGRIEGRVFVDLDKDRSFGPADRPASGVVVAIDGTEVSTDSGGYYRLPPMVPGTYSISVRELPIDAAQIDPFDVILYAERTQSIDIPLTPTAVVQGVLFEDLDRDGRRSEDETGGFAAVRVVLTGENAARYETTTGDGGDFSIRDVIPGRHVLQVETSTLPARFEFTTPSEIAMDVASRAQPPVEIGGFIRPQGVVVTFQPPTASIAVSPGQPAVGQAITFDGSSSFDFDGQIVLYEWDFDGDGAIDAVTPVASHAYTAAGTYNASLTVTDDNGSRDTLSVPVTVVDAEPSAPDDADPAGSQDGGVSPTATASTVPDAALAGDPITFDATPSIDPDGEIVAYAWDFDADGTVDAVESVTAYTYAKPGNYPVSLTVIDDQGNPDTLSFDVDVSAPAAAPQPDAIPSETPAPPVASFSYSPSAPRVGEPVAFDGTVSSDPDGSVVLYAWDFDGDAVIDASGGSAIRSFSAAGDYDVTLSTTDNDGQFDAITIRVTVSPLSQPPIAGFSYAPQPGTAGSPMTFNGTLSTDPDGDLAAFAWDFDGDGTTDATDPISESAFTTSGTYAVSLTVTDSVGNSDTLVQSIDVAAAPAQSTSFQPPIADFSYAPGTATVGEPVAFDGSLSSDFDGEIAAYAWDFGNDGTVDASGAQVDHIFTEAGEAAVRLTVTDNDGNDDTLVLSITVSLATTPFGGEGEAHLPPLAQYAFSPSSPMAGEPIEFNGMLSTDIDGEVVGYAWDFDGDGATDSTSPIVIRVFGAPGDYEVQLTVIDNDDHSDTLARTISVN